MRTVEYTILQLKQAGIIKEEDIKLPKTKEEMNQLLDELEIKIMGNVYREDCVVYTKVMHESIEDLAPSDAKMLDFMIKHMSTKSNSVQVRVEDLKDILKMSKPTVIKSIEHLFELDYIGIKEQHRQTSIYIVNPYVANRASTKNKLQIIEELYLKYNSNEINSFKNHYLQGYIKTGGDIIYLKEEGKKDYKFKSGYSKVKEIAVYKDEELKANTIITKEEI